MKLYATTTSERASKGQGGNEYIDIELKAYDRVNPIGNIFLEVTEFSGWRLRWIPAGDISTVLIAGASGIPQPKGKQKKGELCNCGKNPGFHKKQDNCKQ